MRLADSCHYFTSSVGGCNQYVIRGSLTICQGLSPQKGFSEDRCAQCIIAFNSLRRDSFLTEARVRILGIHILVWQAYSSPTRLFMARRGLPQRQASAVRLNIGPGFFDLTVDGAARGVQSEFNVWYLDDATLCDYPKNVHDDLVVLHERLIAIGFKFNEIKYELTILNDSIPEATGG